jgi:hypothetical protein
MRELELESAELLPNRETLNCWRTTPHGSGSYSSSSFSQSAGGPVGQIGLVNVANSFNNINIVL